MKLPKYTGDGSDRRAWMPAWVLLLTAAAVLLCEVIL